MLVGRAWRTDQVVLKRIRVQKIVDRVKISDAMKSVASRARDGIGNKSRCPAVFGRVVVGGYAVFLDRLGRQGVQRSGNQVVIVLETVQQKIGCRGALSVHRKPEPASERRVRCDAWLRNEHGVNVAAFKWEIVDLAGIDHFRHCGFKRRAMAFLRFKRAGLAGVDIRPEERHNGFRTGKENAVVLTRFPDVVERPEAEVELDARGHGQFQLLHFLRLITVRRHSDLVESR